MGQTLFTKYIIDGRTLKNRLTMAPVYLGYAAPGGKVSSLLLEHYRLMAESGVAMVVVESATVDYPAGAGSDRILRLDTDDTMDGLQQLAQTIQKGGALACQQINHVGRLLSPMCPEQPVAPSEVAMFGRTPHALTRDEIKTIRRKFVEAALRVKKAGFDMVELHGGTGYLLAQFVSPRTNLRADEYGGDGEGRHRFGLEVLAAVKDAVGDFPVGYRFMAEEWMPEGLTLQEAIPYAEALDKAGISYLSISAGTYEAFVLPEIAEKMSRKGFMADLAAAVKPRVQTPVLVAGRIATPQLAADILNQEQADLIALGRVLWADPEWPQKARENRGKDIIHCDPECGDTCMKLIMQERPAFCTRWSKEKRQRLKALFV